MSKRRGNFLLLGALIGFIAGLFFAPKKGSELRRDAKNKIDEIKENPKDVLQGTFDDVKEKINETADNIIYGMPILESVSIADVKSRIENLSKLKVITDSYRDFIVNIRIGGNDFCSRYGVRRKINDSIYDIRVISDIISDIVNIFSADYVVSAPVWEYFENPNDSSEEWKTGLRAECEKDIINGLFGKTAIHPSQLPVIDDVMAVTYSDYMDAVSILNWNDSSLAVSKSAEGNRMNEQKVHTRWAEKVLLRSSIYGVRENI